MLERSELKRDDPGKQRELEGIYVSRGLDALLAKQVARQLMAHDALGKPPGIGGELCCRRGVAVAGHLGWPPQPLWSRSSSVVRWYFWPCWAEPLHMREAHLYGLARSV